MGRKSDVDGSLTVDKKEVNSNEPILSKCCGAKISGRIDKWCSECKAWIPQPTDTAHMDQKRMNLREGSQQGIQSTEKECEHQRMPYHFEGEPEHALCVKCWKKLPDGKIPTESSSNWMKELEKQFYDMFNFIEVQTGESERSRLKSFISEKLSESKQEYDALFIKKTREWEKGVLEQGRAEERKRMISEIQSVKKRFLCGACNGAKCEHTLGCRALNELLDKLN